MSRSPLPPAPRVEAPTLQPPPPQQLNYDALAISGLPTQSPAQSRYAALPSMYPQYSTSGSPLVSGVVTSNAPPSNGTPQRYPIPPAPGLTSRHLMASRAKGETKRRTKTGCYTCRKRRIKCDEAKPTCRNCEKSHRDCLGYEILGGNADILAASVPPPSLLPRSTAGSSTLSSNPGSLYPPLDQRSPASGSSTPSRSSLLVDSQLNDPILASMARNQYPSALQSHRAVKPIVFDDLFTLNDIPPEQTEQEQPVDGRATDLQAVRRYFNTHYANALDDFFDTTWYTQHGFAQLQQDPSLLDYIVHCESRMRNAAQGSQKSLQSLEARLVWKCAVMPRSVSDGIGNAPSHLSAQEVIPRVDTIEKLLSGGFLDPDQVPPSPPLQPSEKASIPAGPGVATKQSIPAFWHYLAIFTSLRDDLPDSGAVQQISDNLQTLRFQLNSIESRDVIYSICILRHIGGRMIGYHPSRHLVATTNDPADNVSKLKAAAEFLEQQQTTASNQVISRICGMARRSSTLQKQN